ncbi:MAG: DNA polymerase I, partial [Acidimicrobiia bacterium]|nr:DNA polymerase I [Acidimicrobiia bacterium]
SAPDIFRSQVPLIKEVLEAMAIPQVSVAGFEADDVIATLAERGRALGYDVVVVTGDRDAFQLSSSDLTILYTRRGISDTVHATPAWIEERYGIDPSRYVEYAALRGDTSDNLPGVPGVGEKTAAKLINEYATLEDLFAALGEMTPKLRENLAASQDQVLLNRKLMTMVRDVAMEEIDPEDLVLTPFDRDIVRSLFDDLAFRSLWQRLEEMGGVSEAERAVVDVDVVTSTDGPVALGTGDEIVAIDPVWDEGDLQGFVIADDPCVYVPLAVASGILAVLSERPRLALHDAKPFLVALLQADLPLPGLAFDTMLAAYIINPAQRAPSLEDLAYRELGITVDEVEGGERGGAQSAFEFEATAIDLETPARRALAVARLVAPLTEQMDARGGLDLYRDIEIPLVAILASMEDTGIGLDVTFLTELGEDLTSRIDILQNDIHTLAGNPFNVNSTLQLRSVLFDQLGLPVLKNTPKGVPSTDASVLEKLADQHDIVAKLLAFRELDKLRSTYVVALVALADDDGRIRGRFNQMGAATGRLSMERPNLQNIPARSEEGMAIRRAFVA